MANSQLAQMHCPISSSPVVPLQVRVLSLALLTARVFATAETAAPAATEAEFGTRLAPSPDPGCKTGLTSPRESNCCCAASCGRCGGTSCQDLPGGADACCCGEIQRADRSCNSHSPPCWRGTPPTPPRPTPPIGPPPPVRPKRGFVADSRSCDDPLLLNTSGWYYGVAPPYHHLYRHHH